MNQDGDREESDPREGHYANYFEIGHNAFEFVLDFGQLYERNAKAKFHTRIVTGPVYAKALSKTLHEGIKQYESTYGVIEDDKSRQEGEIDGNG